MAPKRKLQVRKADDSEEPITEGTMSSPPHEALQGSGNIAELYATLQAAVAEDPTKIDEHARDLLQMLSEAESPEVPLLLRVRTLEFVTRYGPHLRDGNALKKLVSSLVKILSGAEDTPQLLIAAVQGIASLGPVSVLDKKWEYLSREGADVLMQVMLDTEGFAENVRQAASKALDALVETSFRPVVTKLLHWLSDDREADDEEQLAKERRMALAKLRHFAAAPALRAQWTEEVQEHTLGLVIRVFSTVTAREFVQLASVAAALPMVREKGGLPLLSAFLARNKLTAITPTGATGAPTATGPGGLDRVLESLGIIAQHVTAAAGACDDVAAALDESGLMRAPVDTAAARGSWHARAIALAARLATPERTDAVLSAALEQTALVVGDGAALPENLSTLEALLFALIAAGQKRPAELLRQLGDEAFAAACGRLAQAVEELEPLALFAVKKQMQRAAAAAREAEALGCLHNLRVILGAFSTKHIPMGTLTESWLRKHKLPTLTRERPATAVVDAKKKSKAPLGDLPPPPGTNAHQRKRIRSQSNSNSNKMGNGRPNGRRGGFY